MKKTNLFKELVTPSSSLPMDKANGYILLEDIIVAKVIDNNITIVNEDLCPVRFFRNLNFASWCTTRALDLSRTNSRLLRKALKLQTTNSVTLATRAHCSVITDRYWYRPFESNLKYSDIKNKSDALSDTALAGINCTSIDNINTPELTNTGSFEKCWKKQDCWMMYKKATPEARFSEILIYKLGEFLGFDMAVYYLVEGRDDIIASKDFTDNGKFCLEPFESFNADNSNISDSLYVLSKLGYDFVHDYFNMIFMDVLCYNQDRHTFNYGILRDCTTGDAIKLAPNFDNNLALISLERRNEIPKEYETEFVACAIKKNYNIPYLDEGIIDSIVLECSRMCNFDKDLKQVSSFIWNNYNRILDKYSELSE